MKRGRKKFGGIRKAAANTLQDVLRESHDDIVDWIGAQIHPAS